MRASTGRFDRFGASGSSSRRIASFSVARFIAGLAAPTLLAGTLIAATAEQQGIVELLAGDKANSHSEFQTAMDHYKKALALFQEARLEGRVGEVILGMAYVHYNLGQLESAEKDANEALRIGKKHSGSVWTLEANACRLLGDITFDRSDYSTTIDYFERALELAVREGSKGFTAQVDADLGAVYWSFGDYKKGIEFSERCLKVGESLRNEGLQTAALIQLGNIHLELTDYREARDCLERALVIVSKENDAYDQAVVYDALAYLYSALGDREKTMAIRIAALNHAQRIGSDKLLGGIKESLGHEYLTTGDLALADSTLVAAEASARRSRDEWNLVWIAQDLARLRTRQGRYGEAVLNGQKAVQLAEKRNDLEQTWSSHYWLGCAYRGAGDRARALDEFLRGISSIETVRPGIQQANQRSGFMASKIEIYESALAILIDDRRASDAFLVSEKYRARAFYEMLLRPSLISRSDVKQDPEFREIFFPRFAGLEDVRRDLIGEGEVFVEYMLGESDVYGFAVTKDHFVGLRLGSSQEISRMVNRFLEFFAHQSPEFEGRAGGRRLYDVLLKPLFGATGIQPHRIVVSPDSTLHLLPFEALVTPRNHFLIQDAVITYASSATILQRLKSRRMPPSSSLRLIGVADPERSAGENATPEIPFSFREVKGISRFFPDRAVLLTGETATKANFFSQDLVRPTVFHFATHAIVDETDSLNSRIILYSEREGDDLYFSDIVGKHWNSPLAVLSACSSGRGRIVHGEGLDGFARCFLCAGVNCLVLTLWNVEDEASFHLMDDFYDQLAAGEPIDEALRNAKLRHIGEHPAHWAAFVCTGGSREPLFPSPFKARLRVWLWTFLGIVLIIVVVTIFVLRSAHRVAPI